MKKQINNISSYLLQHVAKHPKDIVTFSANAFSVTPTTVHRHLNRLIKGGEIIKTGNTKQTLYYLADEKNKSLFFKLSKDLDEFFTWEKHLEQDFTSLDKHVYSIIEYYTTEVINNAIDHSQGKQLTVKTFWDAKNITITIIDDGIGVFDKIRQGFHLDNINESLLELSKGKITTDPENHTGEGLFFSSKAADVFTIEANGLLFCIDNLIKDWYIASSDTKIGSKISLQIARDAPQELSDIFLKFQSDDNLEFDKTEIYVDLALLAGDRLISRSQAKRITRNLENFTHITLDFKKVNIVGQGFVDQVFRVYQSQHPGTTITYCNANDEVKFMITRSLD